MDYGAGTKADENDCVWLHICANVYLTVASRTQKVIAVSGLVTSLLEMELEGQGAEVTCSELLHRP